MGFKPKEEVLENVGEMRDNRFRRRGERCVLEGLKVRQAKSGLQVFELQWEAMPAL